MTNDPDPATVCAEWGTIYTTGGCKDHLMTSCPRITDRHIPVDAADYPPAHLDLCGWCASRFDAWRDGLARDGKQRCERCGTTTSNVQYCRDCQTHVERMRVRR